MSENTKENIGKTQTFTHNVFNNDPLLFKSYIDQTVNITTEDGTVLTGIVYTVDPVSESMVLINLKENQHYDLTIVLGHSIKHIEVLAECEYKIPNLFIFEKVSGTETLQRKEMIKQTLLENLFPVMEKDDVIYIKDTVRIEPPYGIENCISTNTIILNRIQKILKNILK